MSMHPDPDIAACLAGSRFLTSEKTAWGGGAFPLEIAAYAGTDILPPVRLVSSVRCIIVQNYEVLVMQNKDGRHIIPGGRCEPGEAHLATLKRELLEETGLVVSAPKMIGFMHLKHLAPKPKDFPYPYPHFFHPVYIAREFTRAPNWQRAADEVEFDHCFTSIALALADASIPCYQRELLKLV
jgi:8-oxo-dGTP pyrophosphatase MutT (NUDIX family)